MMSKIRDLICIHEGVKLKGKMALPAGPGPHPALIVMHSGLGLSDFMVERITRLAEAGYVAIAPDMYGDGVSFSMENKAGAGIYFSQFLDDPVFLRSRVQHWFAHVKSLPEVDASRLAAMGYCFGGQCALELARSGADIKAAISFHGLLNTKFPAKPDQISAKVAIYTGGRDPHVPQQQVNAFREEMNTARADYQITLFSHAYHSFTDPGANQAETEGMQYDSLATRMSWQGMLILVNETIGSGNADSRAESVQES